MAIFANVLALLEYFFFCWAICNLVKAMLYFTSLREQLWIAGVAQLVERHLAKVQVAGSNPVSRSNPYK